MDKIKVLFVCLGNICRSPLAEGIFRQRVVDRGLDSFFEIDSCGTAAYHIGETPDHRSLTNARKNGVNYQHLGRQAKESDFQRFDYILAMDASNHRNLMNIRPNNATAKLMMMRDFDHQRSGDDVPDPYFGGEDGFQHVFEILDESVNQLIDHIVENHKLG
jgi:protein-tyrosine phosphatase